MSTDYKGITVRHLLDTAFSLFLLFFITFTHSKTLQFYTEHVPPSQIVGADGKVIAGSSHVVILELVKRMQMDAVYTPLPWARAYKIALNEKDSLIYSIARSPLRESKFQWIGKLQELNYHFYGLNNEASDGLVLAPNNIRNLSVVVVRGSIEAELLLQLGFEPEKNMYYADGYVNAFKMALIGRVDAVYANQFLTNGITKMLSVSKNTLTPIYSLNQSVELYLAANKDFSPTIINKLKKEFHKMEQEGLVEKLLNKELERIFSVR